MNPYEREVAHLRHVISTAKIVVTLTAGIAVTFVAAELQGTQSKCWEIAAAIFTVPMLGATLGILMLRAPSHEGDVNAEAFRETKSVADLVHWLTVAQVSFSAISGLVAALGLLK
jgi:hypothetical protein